MSIELLELAAATLDDLLPDVVFVGGATIETVDHRPRRSACTTDKDVDVVVVLTTKLEAFKSRGRGDLLGSRDFGDIIALIDGRAELIDEVLSAEPEVCGYIAEEIRAMLDTPRIGDGLAGAAPPDAASQARVDESA